MGLAADPTGAGADAGNGAGVRRKPLQGPAELWNRMQQRYNPPRSTAERVDESLQKQGIEICFSTSTG